MVASQAAAGSFEALLQDQGPEDFRNAEIRCHSGRPPSHVQRPRVDVLVTIEVDTEAISRGWRMFRVENVQGNAHFQIPELVLPVDAAFYLESGCPPKTAAAVLWNAAQVVVPLTLRRSAELPIDFNVRK